MKKFIVCAVFLVAVGFMYTHAANAATYYVATTGSDSANGSIDGVLTAVEGCAAIHGHSTPPPAGWLAAIRRGSLSGPRDLDGP